ncbi:MAG: TatD family hydrolase [Deltaproteobacteria bacterium]|nr:TatD family hydrolase [Candidatus Anaeroferrophillus wilburensis]MBN2888204.1 TatD family hydrolase [Deltaproteobacteria bacterium]
MRLFDSHSHINMDAFADDLDDLLARSFAAGMAGIVAIGTTVADSIRGVEIAEQWPQVYATVGIHPHEVKDATLQSYEVIKSLAASSKVVAYGEIGLDFFRNHSPRKVQITEFVRQLGYAGELQLPVVIHDREAHREVLEIIKAEEAYGHGGIIHCFSGDYRLAAAYVDLGFMISIPGTITFRNNQLQAEVVKHLSLEDLLIETDCPYLTPVPHRGRRNEPLYVHYVAEAVGRLKGIPAAAVAEQTCRNATRLFGVASGECEK